MSTKVQKQDQGLQGKYQVKGSQLIGENHSFYILKRKKDITKDKSPNYLLFKNPSKYCSSIYPNSKQQWEQAYSQGERPYFDTNSTAVSKWEFDFQGKGYTLIVNHKDSTAEIV